MWISDSGASRHMTGNRVRLSNLNEKKTSHKVVLGDKKIIYTIQLLQELLKMTCG
jgi:hypothetical protein